MKIGMTGAGGFIGTALKQQMEARGWSVKALPRRPSSRDVVGCDAIVHLAGEPVAGRWTAQKKTAIERSRVEGTRTLVDALARLGERPRVFVSASAVGYYGDRGYEPLFESSRAGNSFLSKVCTWWEAEAARAEELGVRTVTLRTGIVLGNGGALEQMIGPFRYGVGGPLGNGRQFVPWIHIDDIAAMYIHAIESEDVSGPVNAVTPDYATSARMSQAIGAAIRRPSLLPAPALAMRAVLGEFATSVLGSQLIVPARAVASKFVWRHPRLETALQAILGPGLPVSVLKTFEAEQTVRAPLEEVFQFFSQARNLQAITPPSLRFAMSGEAPVMREGAVIDYRLALHGLPMRWKTLISQWNPPHAFTDVQLRGPYALWEHRHEFEGTPQGTKITDRITYALPFQPFGNLAAPSVRRDIEGIFAHRSRVIANRFGAENV